MLNSLSNRVSLIDNQFLLILNSAFEKKDSKRKINKDNNGSIYLVNFNILYKEGEPDTLIFKYIKYHEMFLYCFFSFIIESSKRNTMPFFVLSNCQLFI
jgi:hypothetical protein